MAFQARSGSAAGATIGGSGGSGSSAMSASERAAFRSTRNELAQTLRMGAGAPHESRSGGAAGPGGRTSSAAAASSYAGLSAAAPAASSSGSATTFPPIGSATPRTATFSSSLKAAAGRMPSAPSGAHAGHGEFASTDKEETKESSGAAGSSAAAAAALSSKEKEKDWHLWNGAPEAQWILSVLDDISHKLQLASLLHPDLLKQDGRGGGLELGGGNSAMDAELLLTLKEHFQVESQYHEFLDSDLWKMGSAEPKNRELFRELDLCLADSTRTVTRLLKQQPLLVRRLRELGVKRSPATLDFLNTFARLRQLLHAQLQMTAEEERHMREQLAELRVLEEEDTARFVELTERLAVERSEHEQALASKERKIERLQAQIAQLQSRTAAERQMFEEKMREENDAAEKAFKATEKDLLKQLDSLSGQLETDGSEHFRTELLYHRKKNLRAADVTALIEKYDTDMTLKHESVVDMDAVHAKEKAELEALAGYFAVRDEEDRRLAEEHARIRAERDRELHIARKEQQASLMVQSLYKPWMAKHGPKEPKKKKEKKKKDPFALIRKEANAARLASARARRAEDEAHQAAAASAAAAAAAASGSDGGMLSSPAASGPEDSEGAETAGEEA